MPAITRRNSGLRLAGSRDGPCLGNDDWLPRCSISIICGRWLGLARAGWRDGSARRGRTPGAPGPGRATARGSGPPLTAQRSSHTGLSGLATESPRFVVSTFGTGLDCPVTDCSVPRTLFGCVWWIDGDRFVVSEVDEAGPQASEAVVCALGGAGAEHVHGFDGSVMALPGLAVVE